MNDRNDLLLASAARLYSLGVELEAARGRRKELVDRGVPYGSAEMKRAYRDFRELEQLWKSLEQQHLALRDELLQGGKS